ncbi:baseplate complex protein [Escherichia coli]
MSTRHPVILTLNGETVKMLNLKVEAVLPFKDKDQSGQTSGTQKSEGGIKAKELNVTGTVPFRNVEFLTRIFELAEGVDGGGAQTVYRVSNFTAAAINMRQATFTGRVSAPESDSLRAWNVSFTLREYSSVPEKKESNIFSKLPGVTKQTTPGVTTPGASGGDGTTPDTEMSSSDKFWKKIDDWLAPSPAEDKSGAGASGGSSGSTSGTAVKTDDKK